MTSNSEAVILYCFSTIVWSWHRRLAFGLFRVCAQYLCHIGGTRMASNDPGPDGAETSKTAHPTAGKIRIIEDAEATGDTAAAYDFWRAGSGRQQVPGIIKCFGARPDFLRQVVQFSNTIHFSEGHLTRRHKEMIASYVSYLNRCPY